ncbi:MAG: hypothetical protein CL607_02145 [Anaerolineaceae bacterium]|nr:hypothetical protein [Anaerolineaceae bacterium]
MIAMLMNTKKSLTPRYLRLLCLILLMILAVSVQAQQPLAAQLIVTFPDVEVQRAGTDAWIDLGAQSESVVGPGDRVRTGEYGRAFVRYAEGFTIYLLPQSEYLVGEVTLDADGAYQYSGQVMGVTLHQIASDITFSDFALQTVDLTVTRPAPLFGIWSRQEQPDTVTVAEGEAVLAVNGMDIAVEAGQGYFADGIQTTATAIDAPYSAARVEATLFGCPGNVLITTDVDDLRVRSGPGTNYFAVGLVPDGLPISVMNVNERGDWVRIQFRSYFGWVFRRAVADDCGDMPVLSNTAPVEPIRQFVDIIDEEVPFLTPFFLPQDEDRYRYQFEGLPSIGR